VARNYRHLRRDFLATACGTVGLTGIVGASPDENKEQPEDIEVQSAGSSGTATEEDGKMDPKDRRDWFRQMAEKYPDLFNYPDVDSNPLVPYGKRPDERPGTIIWEKTDYTTAKTATGRMMVDCDHYMSLFETDVENQNGERYYFFWSWAAASSHDHIDFTGNIYNFSNYMNVTNAGDVLMYDPAGDVKQNGIPVSVGASVQGQSTSGGSGGGGAGASASISGEFVVGDDVVRPHPEKCRASQDKFCIQWYGDYEGSTSLNGTASLKKAPSDGVLEWEWETNLLASKYPRTV
jgi:hypothetical protein